MGADRKAKYLDFHANRNLAKLYRDNGASMRHLGFYLGFFLFEVARRDWKNVKLILSVGVLTGLGWAGCQDWRWASSVWPGAALNFGPLLGSSASASGWASRTSS